MSDDSEEAIGATLQRLAAFHKTPKALLKATLAEHPGATKKRVAHAAFRTMIDHAGSDSAPVLQDIGIGVRSLD